MAYTTTLAPGVSVSSRDVKLTRGRVEREHTVLGLGFAAFVWEDRTTGHCTIYVNGTRYGSASLLHDAYRTLLSIPVQGTLALSEEKKR